MKRIASPLGKQDGVTLIELLITMALVMIVLTMNTDTFGVIMTQSRQQTQAVGSEIDRIVGFQVLRRDIEHAGYGLPWSFQNSISYSEAASVTSRVPNPAAYNDSPSAAPRAIMSGNNAGYGNSDYLVIKSTVVGTNVTSQKWTYIMFGSTTARTWGTAGDFTTNERVVVVWPNASGGLDKQLRMNGGTFFATVSDSSATIASSFRPVTVSESYLVYGVSLDTDLRMPFNRADYYIARPDPMPEGCAPGTGILYKALVSQSNGGLSNALPVIDCVADMQVAFGLDTNSDGGIDSRVNDISTLTAAQIRQQVREVRVYLLSHEGGSLPSFTYTNGTVRVGEAALGLGRDVDLSALVGTGWQHYRWKVDTMVIRPKNVLN